MKSSKRHVWTQIGALGLLGLAWHLAFWATGAPRLNGDQAIFGVMARDILDGKFHLYFAGQHYLVGIEAYLAVIVSFLTWSLTPMTLKITAWLTACFFSFTLYKMVRELFRDRRVALWAAALSLMAPATFTFFATQSGFVFACGLGNLIVWASWRALRCHNAIDQWNRLRGAAALAGFAWFVFPLCAAYLFASVLIAILPLPGRGALWRRFRIQWKWAPVDLAVAAHFLMVAHRTVSTDGLSHDRFVPLAIALLLLAMTLVALEATRWSDRLPPLSRLMAMFTLGVSPQLIYLIFRPDAWYASSAGAHSDLLSRLGTIATLYLPNIFGQMLTTPPLLPKIVFLWLYLLALAGLAITLAALFRSREDFEQSARAPAVFLALLGLSAMTMFAMTQMSNPHGRHLIPFYSALLPLVALGCSLAERHQLHAGKALLAVVIAFNAFFCFTPNYRFELQEEPLMVWPRYSTADMLELRDAARALGPEQIYANHFHTAYILMFELQNEIPVTTRHVVDRFPEWRETDPKRYAVVHDDQGLAYLRRRAEKDNLTFDVTRAGRWNLVSELRHDGEPLTWREFLRRQ